MAKAVAEGASRVEGMKSKNKLVEFLKKQVEVYKLILEAERRGVEVKSISIHYDPRESSVLLSNPDLRVLLDR